jgi:site-specific recombinase XerD
MEALTNDFLLHCRNRYSRETVRHLTWQMGKFRRYLEEQGRDYRAVSKEDVETYLISVTHSQQIRRKMLATVRAFYEFAIIRNPGDVMENPCRDLQVGREKAAELPRVPSVHEIAAALPTTSGGSVLRRRSATIRDLRNRAMIELAYGSALRRAEIVRLNIADIDCCGMTARITGKGNKVRIVPLTHAACDAVREYLLERKAARGPLFVAHPQGTRLAPVTLNGIFSKTGGIRPHLYRHACATHMLESGCDIRIIQELLGHEYLTTTQVYTHIDKHDLRRVVNRIHPRSRARSGPVWDGSLPRTMERTSGPFADTGKPFFHLF